MASMDPAVDELGLKLSESAGDGSIDPSFSMPDSFAETALEDNDNINKNVIYLKRALLNEKASPEVLPYESELMELLIQGLQEQQEAVDSAEFSAEDSSFGSLYQMEIDRIRYLIASYLRTRLAKIKEQVLYLVKNRDTEAVPESDLSPGEWEFATDYWTLKTSHFKASALDQLPDDCNREEDEDEMVCPPSMGEWVFCLVHEDVGDVTPAADATETITMGKGDAFVLRYDTIAGLVKHKSVSLS